MSKYENEINFKKEELNDSKQVKVTLPVLDTLFNEFYKELNQRSKIVYYKSNQALGFKDNIYTTGDLLHDLYFSLKKMCEKETLFLNSKSHFIAICYLRMRDLYYTYLKKKWQRAKTEKIYFTDLGYTNKPIDIIAKIFDNDDESLIRENITEQDILNLINDFDNEEQKRVLNLKIKHVTNEKLGAYLGYDRDELRSKIYYSRKKMFKKMKEKKMLKEEVSYNDIIGRDSDKTKTFNNLGRNKKNYYNDYPFELSYNKKVIFVISKNNGKITVDDLVLIIKINEGQSLKQNVRDNINKSINRNIADNNCFLMDGILYSVS
jgi:DNA-directed RNA polymerase specialized sigma24 family protein